MSNGNSTRGMAGVSPRLKARIAGVCYLISGMAYSYADGSVRGKLIVAGDAAATARNILAHETLYRFGFASEIVSAVLYLTVTLLLYDMFRPVDRSVSLLAAVFSFTGCAIQAASTVFHLAPMLLLGKASYLAVFNVEQLEALALMFLKLRTEMTSIYMVFFGWYCVTIGWLIFKSRFMPRILGVFMAIAGLAYQLFLLPPLAVRLFPYVVAPAGGLGELSLILWLIVFGVNARRWKEQEQLAYSFAN